MIRDVYSGYINSKKNLNKQEAIQDRQISTDERTMELKILKDINSKLDSLKSEANQLRTVDLAIINGSVVIPDQGIFNLNVYVDQGKIISLTACNAFKATEVIDAEGKYVLPGIIDPHVHLGLFAPLEVELETETRSALVGGVTTIGCYFSDEGSYFKKIPNIEEEISRLSHVDIIPHLVVNNDIHKSEINDYVNHLGVTSFKLYMNGIPGLIPSVDDGFILDVFGEVQKSTKECMICVHAENSSLVRRAEKLEKERLGENATVYDWSNTHPELAEEEAVIRLSYLAEKTNTKVYFVHISSAEAIDRIRKLKPFNKLINIETTSPYLSISRSTLKGNLGKMEPPFRDISDIEELWKAVDDGVIDTIGTDNVTLTKQEKNHGNDIWNTLPGYPALATHLPVLLNEGVVKRGISIEKVIKSVTKKPAKLFGVYPQKGTLLPGSDADIVVVDLKLAKEVDINYLSSRSDFSLYEGHTLQGWPVATIKSGEVVFKDGKHIETSVKGNLITR